MLSGFPSLGVPAELVACLATLGITEPYPIQSATLPDALRGEDLFAQSPTGSGKTLAFAIPLVARIGKGTRRRPRALVLAPTRELAAQIAEAIEPLARASHRRVAAFYGGIGYKAQLAALDGGVDIVVGCPGRLIDLRDRRALDLAEVEVVVIDEADRMADMGFLPAVRQLLDGIKGARQTMLFSATLTREVERLVRDYQNRPKRHVLELASHEVGSRTHEFWRVAREDRAQLTAGVVAAQRSAIVFCRTKHGAERLARQLSRSGVAAVAIHGDRSQSQRDRALAHFRDGRAQVLVGTDVAARGLHVDGVDCVVHFDPPEDEDTYVHRSGRTGRAGSSGRVVSFVSPDQERTTRALRQRFGAGSVLSQPPQLAQAAGQAAGGLARGRDSTPAGAARPRRHVPTADAAGGEGAAARRRRRRPATGNRSAGSFTGTAGGPSRPRTRRAS